MYCIIRHMSGEMNPECGEYPVFRWLGTAGFMVTVDDETFLIDPYLSRNQNAKPTQSLTPEDLKSARDVFLTHGHFDHILDVPEIVRASGADVYCSHATSENLLKMGVPISKINPLVGNEKLKVGKVAVDVFRSRHIRFDLKLLRKTLGRIVRSGMLKECAQLMKYGAGTVLVYAFDYRGLRFLHLGSLGFKPKEAAAMNIPPLDILLIPVQGHTNIRKRAAELTLALKPKSVVPHHHDDFFPPVSQEIYLEPLRRMVEALPVEVVFFEPRMDEPFTPGEIFSVKGR